MKYLFIVTGANGHLGNTIIRYLKKLKQDIRALILDTFEKPDDTKYVKYFKGDIRNIETLYPLFKDTEDYKVIVIHTAGIINISNDISKLMYDVNVEGTKTMTSISILNNVHRFIYVSSVHAIPFKNNFDLLKETKDFSKETVIGGYAKTKAIATSHVLDMVNKGLNAIVIHPSGIIGPYDTSGNHLVQLIKNYVNGKMNACVKGGYDFVDVRDVASGIIRASIYGNIGECYILSNRHYEIKEVLEICKDIKKGKRILMIPLWLAKIATPLIALISKIKKEKPLYTNYSLYTINSNDKFSHDKATKDLNYRPRDLYYTVRDTISWIEKNNKKEIKNNNFKRKRIQKIK